MFQFTSYGYTPPVWADAGVLLNADAGLKLQWAGGEEPEFSYIGYWINTTSRVGYTWGPETGCVKMDTPSTVPHMCFGKGNYYSYWKGDTTFAGANVSFWSPPAEYDLFNVTIAVEMSTCTPIVGWENGAGQYRHPGTYSYFSTRTQVPDPSYFKIPQRCTHLL